MNKNLNFLFQLSRVNALLARHLSAQGLSFSDFMILCYLSEAKDNKLRRIDLAELLGLTASGITRMLLPMEKIGLIERDLSEDDGRARYALLTKAGQRTMNEAKEKILERIEDLASEKKLKINKELVETLTIIKL